MESNVLKKLREQRAAIDSRIRREESKRKAEQRKADTRRKVLAGAAVLDRVAKDDGFKSELHSLLAGFLTRDDDRALFGLPPLH